MLKQLKWLLVIVFLSNGLPTHAQSSIYNPSGFRDDFGGDLAVSCSGHPHKQNLLSASENSLGVITISVTNAYYAPNEGLIIQGTSTGMDWTYPSIPNPYDSAAYVLTGPTGSGPYTYTLQAFTPTTVSTVTGVGTIKPGFYTQGGLSAPFGTTSGFCTPEDHWEFIQMLGAACAGSGCTGTGAANPSVFTARFGTLCNAANWLGLQFVQGMNFTHVGPDTDTDLIPTPQGGCATTANTQYPSNPGSGTKLGFVNDLELDLYAGANLTACAAQPMPDLNFFMNNNYFNKFLSANQATGDIYGPYWTGFATCFIRTTAGLKNQYRSPHFCCINGPDTDNTKIPGAGVEFPTSFTGSSSPGIDAGIQVLESSPLMAGQNVQPYPEAALLAPYVFRDPINYSKTPAALPPTNCNFAISSGNGPCTLYDYLHKEYGTIGALNTAWSCSSIGFGCATTYAANYTTFGSSGVQYGYSYPWIVGGTHAAPTVAGNGTPTFSTTLNGIVDPYSVQVFLNGTDIGNDCPSIPYQNCKFSLNLSGVTTVNPGVSTTYSGTITGGTTWLSSNCSTLTITMAGFASAFAANNGTFNCLSTTATTITVANTAGIVDPGDSGTGFVNGLGFLMGPGVWHASLAIASGEVRTDSNGNIEVVTVPGTTKTGTAPTWPSTCTGTQTTSDGSASPVTWTCLGPGLPSGTTVTAAFNAAVAAGSVINYASGVANPVFHSNLSSANTISFNYEQNGWMTGTGLMDEDGNNNRSPWVGTNQGCLQLYPTFVNSHAYNVNDEINVASPASWQMVTVAGTAQATGTPAFSGTAGTLVTSGGATFESLGAPSCPTATINANQNLATDIENWRTEQAAQYFNTYRSNLNTYYPDILYGGADVLGAYNRPPPAPVLAAANLYTDYIYSTVLTEPNDPNIDAKVRYVTEFYTKPIVQFSVWSAGNQSLYHCGTIAVNGATCFNHQADKANGYAGIIKNALNSAVWNYNGIMQFGGMQWWFNTPAQTQDFGFSTNLVNLYDGNENVTGVVPCSYPLAAFNCGGELPTVGVPPSFVFYITSAGNMGAATTCGLNVITPASGQTVYCGTFNYGVASNAYATSVGGQTVTTAQLVNSGNNVSGATIVASTPTALTVVNSGGVAEITSFSGTVSVIQSSSNITWVSGATFTSAMVGKPIQINAAPYTVSTVNSSTSITLTALITQVTGTYSYSVATATAAITSNWLAGNANSSSAPIISAANLLWLGPAVPTIACSSPNCLSSTLYAFDSAAVGTSSEDSPTSPPAITVTNTGSALTGVTVTASTNFSETNNCGSSVTGTCTISPTFTPTATGNLTGTITFAWTSGGGGTLTVNLSGTGLAAGSVVIIPQNSCGVVPVAANSTCTFQTSNIGVPSSDSPESPAVSNTLGSGLTSVACSITGTNSADFVFGGACPTTLANDAIFSMPGITFTPSIAGAESASLNVSYSGGGGGGSSFTAAGCSQSQVDAALGHVGSGAWTIIIPGGTCHWTTTESFTIPSGNTSLTVQGATTVTCTGTAGTSGYSCTPTNNTVIVDDYTGSNNILTFTLNSTGFFRWTGMTINYGLTPGNGNANGELSFFGGGGGQQLRIDHSHFNSSASTYSAASPTLDSIDVQGCIFGVIDHNVFDNMNGASGNPSRNNIVVVRNGNGCGTDPNGFGDGAFASTVQFGSNQFLFMEANVYNIQTAPGGEGSAYVQIDDCWAGGKYVARYNNVNGGKFQTHATGANGPHRGCYAEELYGNYVNIPNGDGLNTVQYMSSGALLHWGNTITGTGWNSDVDLISTRSNNASYSQGTGGAGGWGYCGTAFNGTGSIWDASSSTSSGYPCLDQPGRGKSDLLSGTFSPATRQDNVYSAPHWPNQALTPLYVWENSCSGCSTPISNGYAGVFTENTDYYQDAGLNGVVDGTLAARPSTCTTGHAYWETDHNQLDYCNNSTTVWSTLASTPASYVPYTYPHPLTMGGGGSTTVSAPLAGTGVGASVTISPGSYAFADTVVTNTSTDSPLAVTITNNLSGSINVSSVSLGTANFTQSNSCSTIPAGSPPANQCVVMVDFTPLVTGALSDTLTVVYTGGGGGMLTSALSGNGLLQPPPSTGTISLPPGWPF